MMMMMMIPLLYMPTSLQVELQRGRPGAADPAVRAAVLHAARDLRPAGRPSNAGVNTVRRSPRHLVVMR